MNETYTIERKNDRRIDELAIELLKTEVECELDHTFTPGLYSREMGVAAGVVVVSKHHRSEHQFCVLRGSAMIMVNDNEWEFIVAPYKGITKPGTRRVFYILQDMSFITFHATDKTTPEEVEADIIEPYIDSVLGIDFNSIRSQLNKLQCHLPLLQEQP